jgi:hypothetical protein
MKPSKSTDIAIYGLLLALAPLMGACSQEYGPSHPSQVDIQGPDGLVSVTPQELSRATGKWVPPEIQDEDSLSLDRLVRGEEYMGVGTRWLFDSPSDLNERFSGFKEHFGGRSAYHYAVSEEVVETGERYLKVGYKNGFVRFNLGKQAISNLEVVKKAGPDGIIARYQIRQSAEDPEALRDMVLRLRVFKRE